MSRNVAMAKAAKDHRTEELFNISPALAIASKLMSGEPAELFKPPPALVRWPDAKAERDKLRTRRKELDLELAQVKNSEIGKLKGKRRPLLVDQFLAATPAQLLLERDLFTARKLEALRDAMREAKKFVFDADAVRYAGEMLMKHPEAVAFDQEFAIPPFPIMYLEYPVDPLFAALGQTTAVDWERGDSEVGYLYVGPRVYVLSRARYPTDAYSRYPHLMPFAYRLNKPFTLQEEIEIAAKLEHSRMGLDVFYWGSRYEAVKGTRAEHALRANHSFEWLYAMDLQDPKLQTLPYLLQSAAGDLRNIIAFILFLNRTSEVQVQDELGFHHTMIHTKPATLLKHNVVHIKLDPRPLLLKVYGTGGIWRREHEVRGHFCHDKDARESGHHPDGHDWREYGWSEYGVNERRCRLWRCMRCGGLKWWRKACRRGSKDKGRVDTEYAVTQ